MGSHQIFCRPAHRLYIQSFPQMIPKLPVKHRFLLIRSDPVRITFSFRPEPCMKPFRYLFHGLYTDIFRQILIHILQNLLRIPFLCQMHTCRLILRMNPGIRSSCSVDLNLLFRHPGQHLLQFSLDRLRRFLLSLPSLVTGSLIFYCQQIIHRFLTLSSFLLHRTLPEFPEMVPSYRD